LATVESGEKITRDTIISILRHAVVNKRWLIVCLLVLAVGGLPCQALSAQKQVGLSELHRLVAQHQPQRPLDEFKSLDVLSRDVDLGDAAGRVLFSIPGFKAYGCEKCHQGQELLDRAVVRMQAVLTRLKHQLPEISKVPLKQYIIQPWADELLAPREFAHATFDTIRIFPRTILIDSRVYGDATHLHETLHLTQEFVGPANELEAYGLNIRSDPRFLLLNYPYFSDAVTAFFLADFPRILEEFFARPVDENLDVPREVQWFMDPFSAKDLKSLAQAVNGLEPVLDEVTRLLRQHPIRASYWSEQTGNAAFLLEVAAVRLLPLPPAAEISEEVRSEAFAIIDAQMRKTDNTRLGYVINRKQEALLTLKYQLKIEDPHQRLSLYFHYLKERFIGPQGDVRLGVENPDDLITFAEKKLQGISKMAQSGHLTIVEREGAEHLIESIKEKLQEF
jgi:hypothetical protein